MRDELRALIADACLGWGRWRKREIVVIAFIFKDLVISYFPLFF